MKDKQKRSSKQPFILRHKRLSIIVGIIVLIIIAVLLAFRFSPVPGALLIRTVFNDGGRKTLAAMEAHQPAHPVTLISDQAYGAKDSEKLDVYMPESIASTDQALPTVIWTHGGAWLSGDKTDDGPYFKLLADRGFVVVALNYSLAPFTRYPTPIEELNSAHAYLLRNAARFHIDTNKLVLAGDSAGSQFSSQLATIITSPNYAREMDITPTLKSEQISAVVLFCGIYDMSTLAQKPSDQVSKLVGWGTDITVWAYSGTRDTHSLLLRQMSPLYQVTSSFPTTFISGGNADPLTKAQSMPFSDYLKSLGVSVTTLFYPDDHTPALHHENQFVLDKDGLENFETTVKFLKAQTR